MSRKSVLNTDFMSEKQYNQYMRDKALRKRALKNINDIIDNKCKGCWYACEIQKELKEL